MELQNSTFILPTSLLGKDYDVSVSLESLPPHSKSTSSNFLERTIISSKIVIHDILILKE